MSSGKARLLADPRDYDPESEPLLDKDDDDDKGGTSASVRGLAQGSSQTQTAHHTQPL